MRQWSVGLLVVVLGVGAALPALSGSDSAAVSQDVTVSLTMPTVKPATLVLNGGALTISTEGEHVRLALQGEATLLSGSVAASGDLRITDPVLLLDRTPSPDGRLKCVDLSGSRMEHQAKRP